MGIQNFKQRYLNGVRAYAEWAGSQSKAPFDLLVLGLGPIFVFGLAAYTLLGFLPVAASYGVMVVLILAALPLAFHVLRQYAVRYGNHKGP
ncbi:conjugal transfer protein TrbO [Salmonella enterica subsp. enterica serovar Enteritidis]|nr:conjugal transfer protein TrbO [Salmonella enterica subsp. enterica serovar Enteritidis]